MQTAVHLVEGPGQTQAVLAHLQTGGGHAARVGRLGGGKQHAVALQVGHRLGGGGHVRALGHREAAVRHQRLGAFQRQLVLGGAGQRDVAGHVPDALAALHVLGGGHIVQIGLDAGALDFLDFLDDLVVNAVLVHDIAVGIAHGNDLAAQLGGLLIGVDGHVAGAGDDHLRALKALAVGLEHLIGEVAQAVAGGLGAGQRAAVGDALAGQHAGELVAQPLVLAVHEADLPAAHADVTGGHVGVGADVALQLGHKALAEPHDLPVALAVGVKVRAALAAAHGQAGQAVLEHLLKAQELDDGQIHRGVEPQAALVGADGGVELHTVAAVDLHLAGVVHPGHTEHHNALRLHQTLDEPGLLILGMGGHDRLQAFQNLLHRLQKFLLLGVAGFQALVHALQIRIVDRHW